MAKHTFPLLPKINDILSALGENIKLARLRRKITATMLAERAGISRATLSKVEKGDAGVSMGIYATVLFCLRLEQDLLLLAGADPLGRRLQDAGLLHPKQRVPKRGK